MKRLPRWPSLTVACLLFATCGAGAQVFEDGSDAAIGKVAAAKVREIIGQRFGALDPKITALRRPEDSWICGSVNVKNRDGLYLGERGFVLDLANDTFGRVPEGPELLDPKAPGFQALEQVRQAYFQRCLD